MDEVFRRLESENINLLGENLDRPAEEPTPALPPLTTDSVRCRGL
jgi:hypothetical protein